MQEKFKTLVELTNSTASKAVLFTVFKNVQEALPECMHIAYQDVLTKLSGDMPKESGYLSLELHDGDTIIITLGPATSSYRPELMVPEESAGDLLQYIQQVKTMAQTFWKQYLEHNTELEARLATVCDDTDFRELVVDESNPMTMYFSLKFTDRVGVAVACRDKFGNVYRRVPRDSLMGHSIM